MNRAAYVLLQPFGLLVIDINNPDAPLPLSRVDTPSQALNVATAGTFIYVAVLDIIDEELTKEGDKILKFSLIVAGIVLMALLALWV